MASSLVPAPRVVIKIKLKKKTSSLTPTHPLFSLLFLKKKIRKRPTQIEPKSISLPIPWGTIIYKAKSDKKISFTPTRK